MDGKEGGGKNWGKLNIFNKRDKLERLFHKPPHNLTASRGQAVLRSLMNKNDLFETIGHWGGGLGIPVHTNR